MQYHIRNIGSIRRYIKRNACKSFAQSIQISRLDHGSALLYGLRRTLMTNLQRVQNSAALDLPALASSRKQAEVIGK